MYGYTIYLKTDMLNIIGVTDRMSKVNKYEKEILLLKGIIKGITKLELP